MILKNYLFSQTFGGYQQYTTDHSETFLKGLCKNCTTSDQIAIHRSGNLVYYAYAHKNSNSDIYGICVVCGEVCLNLQWLYECFQKAFDTLAQKGVLFCYSESGEIIKNVTNFSKETAEVDTLFRSIKEYLEKRPSYWEKLPAEDFSIPLSSRINLSFEEDNKDKIIDAIRHYHNITITMANAIPTSYARTVERLNNEKKLLSNENNELKENIETLHREKKQYRWVVLLSMAVILSLVGLYFLNDNLSGVISDKDDLISNKNDTIAIQKNNIVVLRDSVDDLESSLASCRETARRQQIDLEIFTRLYPLTITNIEIANYTSNQEELISDYGQSVYSNKSRWIWFRINYDAYTTESVTLYYRIYMPDGNIKTCSDSPYSYSYSSKVYIYSSEKNAVKELFGWGSDYSGSWAKGTYRIEIWYEDVCLRAENFTIY